jgi:hypothetical protein
VVFVLLVGIRTRVSPHWGLTGVVAAVALLVMIDFKWRRGLILSGAVMCLAMCSLVIGIVLFPEAAMGVEWSYRGRPTDVSTSKLADLIGNREIGREVGRRLEPGELVCSESFVWTHAIAFYSGGEIPTRLGRLRGGVAGLASLYWYAPEELEGIDCLWVTTKDDMRPRLRRVFERVRPEPPIEIVRDGRTVRTINLYRCRNLLDTGAFTRLSPAASRDGR